MTFHWIYFVAAVMVILGAVLAKYSVSEAERFYARYLVIAGLVFFMLPAFWGCSSSPTAPSQTVRLTWSPAPGCSPGTLPAEPIGDWLGIVRKSRESITLVWPNGTVVEYRGFGDHYMVCRIL